jgi:hypothetical protein
MKLAFTAVIDQPDVMFGMDNNWLSVYPYQVEANPGDVVKLQVRYRNWLFAESTVRATVRAPEGWAFEPGTVEVHAPPRSTAMANVTTHIPLTAKSNYRYVITLDATRDEEKMGEATEVLVNMDPMKAH